MTQACVHLSRAQSPNLRPVHPPRTSSRIPSPQSPVSNFSLFSQRAYEPWCAAECNSIRIFTTYCFRRAKVFFFSKLQKSLSFSSPHTQTLFCLSLNLLCLAAGQNPFFCLEGGWQHAFEETPRLLLGWPAGSNPAQHSLASPSSLSLFPRNTQSWRRQRLSWSRFPEEIFKQQMKFKQTQRMLELE